MSYFAPYIDDSGLHMPTYEDRLEDLVESYRSIFGVESELSASVPDYQLLSVFAKALDDVSALCLQAYNSRNPQYAAGAALDLLLPQYGITRAAGETDAEVRARIRTSLAGRGTSGTDALLAAVKNARGVKDARVYVNDTDSADADGIPAHSVAVVTRGGNGAAFGKYAEQPNALEISGAWDIRWGGRSLLEAVYPVGSIYLSAANTDPAALLGGAWQALGQTIGTGIYAWERTA